MTGEWCIKGQMSNASEDKWVMHQRTGEGCIRGQVSDASNNRLWHAVRVSVVIGLFVLHYYLWLELMMNHYGSYGWHLVFGQMLVANTRPDQLSATRLNYLNRGMLDLDVVVELDSHGDSLMSTFSHISISDMVPFHSLSIVHLLLQRSQKMRHLTNQYPFGRGHAWSDGPGRSVKVTFVSSCFHSMSLTQVT